jgi:hypothetical protein
VIQAERLIGSAMLAALVVTDMDAGQALIKSPTEWINSKR